MDTIDMKYWKLVYHIGKYYGSNPPMPDQIFKFYHHITNGTLEQFTKDYESGIGVEINDVIIKIKSNNNGMIDLMMPINYPTSNSKSSDSTPFILSIIMTRNLQTRLVIVFRVLYSIFR
jgi:hypothetical protein